MIYASSSSVYGDSPALPKREGEEGAPLSPYAASKVMNEKLAAVFGRCYGIQLIGMRYFNVYGPRQDPEGPYAAVIPSFFKAYAAGQAPVIYGDGEQSRDFTFVADAVAANPGGPQPPQNGSRSRLQRCHSGQRTTVNEACTRSLRGVWRGAGAEIRAAPPWGSQAFGGRSFSLAEGARLCCRGRASRRHLEVSPALSGAKPSFRGPQGSCSPRRERQLR